MKEINRALLKKIMRRYFITTGRLLFWLDNEAKTGLEGQILDLMLAVQGHPEYKEACLEVLEQTRELQTLADCNVLKLSMGEMTVDQSSFLDMKADNLKYYKVMENQVFDMDILLMDNRQAVIDGDPGALRLAACLSWLGLDSESSQSVALRYWQVLAYTGDYFAMEALEYAYTQRQDAENATLWKKIREIFAEADRNFTITVPEHYLQDEQKEAVNVAQVILAVRRRCADDDQEKLPVLLLQYAIDSKEDVAVKLHNLYSPPEAFQAMLTRQTRRTKRPLGFAI